MLDIVETLQNTTRLIKIWGEFCLPDGRTLSEVLTLDGIPLWDAFAVELARNYVPAALAADTRASYISQKVKPHLIRAKYGLRGFIRNRYCTHGCSSWPTGPTILCLGFTDYIYRDVLQPVATRLAGIPDCNVVSLSSNSWNKTNPSKYQDVLHQTVWEHWDQRVILQVSKLRKELLLIESDLHASNDLINIIRDDDRSLYKKLDCVFNRLLRADLPLLIPQAVVAQHILENHRPALVISNDVADPRTRLYTLLCRQMGIPSMEVQFGLAGDDGVEWQFLSADKVVALGDISKEAMLKHGIPAEKITITGSPRHDCLVNVPDAEVKSIRGKLGVPDARVMVLLASAYQLHKYDAYSNPELLHSMKRSLFEAADKTQDICLVVKPHPLEDVRETRALAGKLKNIIFVSQKSDIRELTRVCDGFVSFGSTSTADALISGKLVICPVFPGWIWSDLFNSTGATLVPSSTTEILEIFQLLSKGAHKSVMAKLEPARQNFLANWIYRADGLAAARVSEIALQMAQIDSRTAH